MLEMLENTALAEWVRESPSIFAYTFVLSLHAIGLAIVVGTSTIVGLRLLGRASGIPLSVLRSLYGFIYVGFVVNLVSGVMLFTAEATKMGVMPAFIGKLVLVFVGMVIGQRIKKQVLDDPQVLASGLVPDSARPLARASLACWLLALAIGRLTGYPELVTQWFGI